MTCSVALTNVARLGTTDFFCPATGEMVSSIPWGLGHWLGAAFLILWALWLASCAALFIALSREEKPRGAAHFIRGSRA